MNFEKPPGGGGVRGWTQNSPKSARLRLHRRTKNWGKGAPQAAHTDAPCKNCRQFPSARISSAVFFAFASLTSSANRETKNCQSEKDVDQVLFYAMDGRQCENKQHGDTVPEKACDVFVCSLQINIKARQMWFSTAGYVCSTQTRVIFNPSVEDLHKVCSLAICLKLPFSIFLHLTLYIERCNLLSSDSDSVISTLWLIPGLYNYRWRITSLEFSQGRKKHTCFT